MNGARAKARQPRGFKAYPAYKASGVEWLGNIPVGWEVKPFKAALSRNDSGVWGEDPTDGGTVVLRSTEQTINGQWSIEHPATRHLTAREAAQARLELGDLVVTKSSGSDLHIGKTCVVDETVARLRCGFSNFMQRLRVTHPHEPRFFWYFMNTPMAREQLVFLSSTTTGLGNLNATILGAIRIPAVPPSEQRAVTAFLDRETARIDTLVSTRERLIGLLDEKRTALTIRAITKGLDARAPMRDSGVEWLGEIPAHWGVNRTKFAARLRSGHTPSRQNLQYWQDCTIPWFGLVDVWQIRDGKLEYVVETSEKISELGLANSSARLLPKGTVILSRTASVGFSAILGIDMATTQDFVNWICGPTLRADYLLYVFRAMQQEFSRLTMGSTHQTIYMPDVGAFWTPIPPLREQDQIVALIRKELAGIDTLVVKVRAAIERLQELRTAVISAAVTGKIDVREEVA